MIDFLRRAGWFMLAMLLLGTGVILTVVILWMQNNQSSDTSQTGNSCAFSSTIPAPTLTDPQPYKPETDPTQLVVSDITLGSGPSAKAGDCVVAKYFGNLKDGTVFDQDYNQPYALQFMLGEGEVIPGWDRGLVGMKAGGERRLVIPPKLGYGSTAQGAIPANSTLVFHVKLISIK